jgi:enhancer of polycomb-like protein
MSAAQVSDAAPNVYIPTPDASRLIDFYSEVYNKFFKRPTSYIRFSSTVEECVGCPYYMDQPDLDWLADLNKQKKDVSTHVTALEFESLVSELEKITDEGQKDVCFLYVI